MILIRSLLFFLVSTLAWGVSSNLSLNQEARQIADQLRCPVCRGIPISESPAELAQDMMKVIREKLGKGESEEQILKYFEDRYGEWILLSPKPQGFNLLVWVLPVVLLIGGGGFLALKISQWSRRT
ncbi:MAG: hypothetical protein A3F82_06255 [Deltaproteobacteria bacterium RIFCSPLOWO2_12_FULL_44_12]|nr:MAG: hypothetical protein A2712_01050 [Deltaproteobacteria bacterium RIFCSPHIGHO2_01_FULL_43_49]OGQ15276.1 MAG: hypothetical protein A3D22_04425 [Deltaproteobacteria bacterium RIFCSPHIGHO2_02_FULL_44_53]OGQ27100.1 MAG: hypothetical protein A3D98_01640 [Deltaproteobacteria bacterium RIFCSPHIGHO2_12_FULL_44_21]OGQ31792.1 MAG: hypothetical protein A2979_05585 [Deltaproteobacteria bacterium RIFCSPLOWO2_01_FULL_45_74]OGQ42994.1 MAG: hypothetical protein A3I70_07890 [Deltaproteobacteria bacterium 